MNGLNAWDNTCGAMIVTMNHNNRGNTTNGSAVEALARRIEAEDGNSTFMTTTRTFERIKHEEHT